MQRVNEPMSLELRKALKDGTLRIGSEDINVGMIAFKNADYTTYLKHFHTAQERRDLLSDWACANDDMRESNPNLGHNETFIIIKES